MSSTSKLSPARAARCAPNAWLRPIGAEGRFEPLYWSLSNEQWTKAAPMGRVTLTIDRALEFIAAEDIFWAAT